MINRQISIIRKMYDKLLQNMSMHCFECVHICNIANSSIILYQRFVFNIPIKN